MSKTSLLPKRDICFLFALVILGVILTCWVFRPASSDGGILEVRLDGEVKMRLPLNKNTEKSISTSHGNTNRFQIQDGTVKMTEADCNDHICTSTSGINKPGQSIVCLPHRLVLAIVEEENEKLQPDAVTH